MASNPIHRRDPYKDTYVEIGGITVQVHTLIDYVRDAPLNRDEASALAEQAQIAARTLEHLSAVLKMEVAKPPLP